MATYSTIKGFNVETLSSDPYASVAASGTWASGGDVNTGKLGMIGFGASQNAVLKSVGEGGSPSGLTDKTETYNGTSWTEVADGSQACQGGAGFGTTAAGINATGSTSSVTQTWDGTSWADGNDVNTQVVNAAGIGISTAGMKASGVTPSPAATVDTETYDGTSWTESPDVNQATYQLMGAGTTTAAIIGGGVQLPNTNYDTTETYDGTAWTAVTAMGTGRAGFGCGTSGTQSDWLVFGGGPDTPAYTANTEHWNGTGWTEVANLATAMANGASGGVTTSALSVMGRGPGNIPFGVDTEEFTTASTISLAQEGQIWYNSSSTVLKSFGKQGTLSWSSGADLTTARIMLSGAGNSNTSAVVFGGRTSGPTAVNNSETYNGTAWTEGNNVTQARFTGTGFGVETAAVFATGFGFPTATQYTNAETYDGTCWTEVNNLSVGRGYLAGCGGTSGGLAIGGYHSPPATRLEIVEDYDGTSWTEVGDLSTADVNSLMAAVQGTPTAALAFGGYPGPSNRTESYDGSTWTEVGNLNTSRANGAGSGTQTAALCIGGEPPNLTNVESWNGSTWTETSYDIGTGRYYAAAAGSSTNAILAGGFYTGYPLFSLGTTEALGKAEAIKTFTAS